jgi:calcium-independent phospholipase A2-gamma
MQTLDDAYLTYNVVMEYFRLDKQKFIDNEITTLDELLQLTKSDLQELDVPQAKIELFLELVARRTNRRPTHLWGKEDVVKWLKTKTEDKELISLFDKMGINGAGLLRMTNDDLREEMGMKLKQRKEVWSWIEELKRTTQVFSKETEENELEDRSELICVPQIPEDKTTFCLEKNDANWQEFKKLADRNKYLPRVSFVGPTQCGKSHLAREMMEFEERIIKQRGPSTALPSQEHPTTGNINQYVGNVNNERVVLLDGEGADGRIPLKFFKALKHKLSAIFKPEQLDAFTKNRTDYVSRCFPQLFYILSNVIIFTNRQALANREYIARIEQFTMRSVANQQSRNLPYLIVVQNFCNPPSEQTDSGEDPYDVENSTSLFLRSLESDGHDVKDLLRNSFSGFCFIKIPDGRIFPTQYCEQLKQLKGIVQREIQRMRVEKLSYTLNVANMFTDYMWYRVAERVLQIVNSQQEVNISEIFFDVNLPKKDSRFKAVIKFFKETLTLLPKPVGTSIPDYVKSRTDRFARARELAVTAYCFAYINQLKENLGVTSLQKGENIDQLLRDGYLKPLLTVVNQLQPCEAHDKNGCCMQERIVHSSHNFQNPLRRGIINIATVFKNLFGGNQEITASDDSTALEQLFRNKIENLISLPEEKLHQERVEFVQSWPRNSEYEFCSKYCAFCFSPMALGSMYSCGHMFCKKCSDSANEIVCPFDGKTVNYLDDASKVPKGAAPRVLSLDGGEHRGLVPIILLQHIEKLTCARITELFDYIIGTGSGGLVALSLSSGINLSLCKAYYNDIIKTVFWKRSVKSAFGGPKYSMTKLTKAVKGQLPPKTLLEIGAMRDNPKVAVLSVETSRNKRVLFCSYTPCSNDPNMMYVVNTQLYFAATATSAIPTYLRAVKGIGQLKFVDGGVVTNNPANIGMEEAKRIWPNEADVLVSLGPGIKPATKPSQASPDSMFEWINKFAEVTDHSECTHQELDTQYHLPGSTVYYARFDPMLTHNVSLDSATQDMTQLEMDTLKYIQVNDQKLQDTARMLLAKLFYCNLSWNGSRYGFTINSRLPIARTREIIRQQIMLNYVSLQLDVVAPKVTKKYGNVYLAGGDVLKSTDVLYTQRIELSLTNESFGVFTFIPEASSGTFYAVISLSVPSSSQRFPISGCPIKLEQHLALPPLRVGSTWTHVDLK